MKTSNCFLFLTFIEFLRKISERDITPIMECLLRLFALLEVGDFGFSSRYFKTFLFNENFKLVDPNYSIDKIIEDFDSHINSVWKEEDVIADLKEYDKNILVYLNEYIYARNINYILTLSR